MVAITQDPTAVCVYCAASPGVRPEYKEAAISLGKALATSSRRLVYGGGDMGLMGIVAATVLDNGGRVTGVRPKAMVRAGGEGIGPKQMRLEGGNDEEGKMDSIIVNSMHERKMAMARVAGAGFIALPGGFGTFEEVFEAITWSQLGIHQKPVVLLNVNGYWEPLRKLIDDGVSEGFIRPENTSLTVFVEHPGDVAGGTFDWGQAAIQALEGWTPPEKGGLFDWDTENADKLEST